MSTGAPRAGVVPVNPAVGEAGREDAVLSRRSARGAVWTL